MLKKTAVDLSLRNGEVPVPHRTTCSQAVDSLNGDGRVPPGCLWPTAVRCDSVARVTKPSAKLFTGYWRIVEMEVWGEDVLDLLGPAHLAIEDERLGELQFVAVQGAIDAQLCTRDGRPAIEFSWEGDDDGHPTLGRGWAVLDEGGKLQGRIFIHRGDHSDFTATRDVASASPVQRDRRVRRPGARR